MTCVTEPHTPQSDHWMHAARAAGARIPALLPLHVSDSLHGAGPTSPFAALPRLLAKLPDLERGITRILHRTANPAEFVTVVTSLSKIAAQLGLQVSPDSLLLPGR